MSADAHESRAQQQQQQDDRVKVSDLVSCLLTTLLAKTFSYWSIKKNNAVSLVDRLICFNVEF